MLPQRLGLRLALLLFAALIVLGTVGYMLTERWTVGEALYAAVTTLTTLGIRPPTTAAGKAFTTVYVLIGVGSSFYILSALVVFIAEGQLSDSVRRRRMERAIERLRAHYIICGYGRVGRQIAAEFKREGVPYVLIDLNPASLADAELAGELVITGRPSSDLVLQKAKLDTARGLIVATDSDEENTYVTLTARVLNPTISIVARANHPDAEAKMQRAGANRVISPYSVGGRLMAMVAVRPLAVEFVETVLHDPDSDLLLKDITIEDGSPLVGLTVGEARRRYMDEANVVALKSATGVVFNPDSTLHLHQGDTLAVVGTGAQLARLHLTSR